MGGLPDYDIASGDSTGPLIQAGETLQSISEAYSDRFVLKQHYE